MTATLVRPQNRPVTEREFWQFLREYDGCQLYEQVDGWIRVMAEPSMPHERLRTRLWFWLESHISQNQLLFETHPKMLCRLGEGNQRRPDLLVVGQAVLERCDRKAAILTEPPQIAIEIVSTNWEDDYIKKSLDYARFGIVEYWVADLLLQVETYPSHKHPDIKLPTVAVGTLDAGEYRWQQFTGKDRILSPTFPDLNLTVDQWVAAANA